jgi:WD40 repeat protein/serine/threonine protein kinase
MPQTWKVGDIILDLYRVTDILGEGGFGKVYKVRHQGWNLDLAMKIPLPKTVMAAGGVEGFEQEAETWVNLGLHPHIVSCYYVRRVDSSPAVFAEYLAGGSLHDWISSRRLYTEISAVFQTPLQRLLDIAIQSAWGLHYAHEQGLVHQDVKPANLLLTADGMVKVTDFGIATTKTMARMLNGVSELSQVADGTTLMVTGSGAMTQAYCSPEQANRGMLTRRSDIWSWALSVLEMFQGGRTWEYGQVADQTLVNYLQGGADNPQSLQMPRLVTELLQHCFRPDPNERPHDLLTVARELQGIYQQETGKIYPRQEPQTINNAADSLNNRAVSLFDLGKQEEALQVWEQALQVQPHHLEATYNRGLILWRSAVIDDSALLRALETARDAHSENWRGDYLIAFVNLERNDCEAAIKILEKIQLAATAEAEIQSLMREARQRLPTSRRLLQTFTGHLCPANSVCLSTDNRFALSGSDDHTLKLWEVATEKCLWTFIGHIGNVTSVCLSANGQFALSGSIDNTLKLWEVATGRCLHTFIGHTSRVNSVCLSANSRFALSGSNDKTLKLWDIPTGQCLQTFSGHIGNVLSVCLSADSQLAISGSGNHVLISAGDNTLKDNTLKLWEVETGRCLRTFIGHADMVGSVCLSGDSQFVLSGSDDTTLKLWEVSTGKCLHTFSGHTSAVMSVCLSADSQFALSGGDDHTLKLWEVLTGRCLRTFMSQDGFVNSVCFSTDSRFILSGNGHILTKSDNTLKLWKAENTNPYIASIQLSLVLTTEISISLELTYKRELAQAYGEIQEGKHVAAAQSIRKARAISGYNRHSKAFKRWCDLYSYLPCEVDVQGWENTQFIGHTDIVGAICFSADSRFALSGSNDHTLRLWDVETGKCLRTFIGHANIINGVYLSNDSRLALSGSNDHTLRLWDVETGKCLRTFIGHAKCVGEVCFSADSRFALSGSNDHTLRLWDVETGKCLRTFIGHTNNVGPVCLSGDSQFVLSGSDDHTLKLWEVSTGKCLRTFEDNHPACSVCLSTNGRLALSSGSLDNTLKVWEVASGKCLRIFIGHTSRVTSVCLSTDGHFALSGSCDSTLKLWEVETGKCLLTLTDHSRTVISVCLSADNRFAVSGSSDQTLRLWNLDWELEDRLPTDWDEGARPYLENFLGLHTPYAATLSADHEPTEAEITLALTRRGTPTWTEVDFQSLLYTLGCAGYGWLRPEGVRQQLEIMLTNNKNLLSSPKPQTKSNKALSSLPKTQTFLFPSKRATAYVNTYLCMVWGGSLLFFIALGTNNIPLLSIPAAVVIIGIFLEFSLSLSRKQMSKRAKTYAYICSSMFWIGCFLFIIAISIYSLISLIRIAAMLMMMGGLLQLWVERRK